MKSANSNKSSLFFFMILAFIGIVVYLPLVGRMGYYKDDWYLIYDAHTQGAQFFHEVYEIDRPARGYVMQLAYNVFGNQIIYYHLSGYLFRLLASWCLFWALDMTWPRHRKPNFLVALLLLIYPGFLSQPNPIDYQSQLLSLCLAFASIAFTVKALRSQSAYLRLAWIVASLITGFIYPALVEYMIGLEVLRLSLIAQIVFQQQRRSFKQYVQEIIRLWWPFITAPLTFLVWRVFFFESERRATDVGSQFSQLLGSPLTGLWWLVNWLQDLFRVVLLAWTVPFHTLVLNLRLSEFFPGLGLAVLVVLLTGLALFESRKLKLDEDEVESDTLWKASMLMTGFATALLALLPVIIVNRHADFGEYSRYTLASAAGAAMIMVVLVLSVRRSLTQLILLGLVVIMASFTHYANSVSYAQEAESVRNFWWQVAWRAPNIQPGTTLVASYPVGGIQEDYFIWGPANLIYYPEKQNVTPIHIKLPAAVLTDEVVLQILMGVGEETPLRRGNELTRKFSNILVLAQARENTCVRLLNGNLPDLSTSDPQRIILIAPHSKLDQVMTTSESPMPPASIFGKEPAHDWCYYYQKADLARQQGDWEKVVQLGDEAQKLDLHPDDQIEWMPFLQAYAFLGDQKQVRAISTRINTQRFYMQQACTTLTAMTELGYPLSADMSQYVNELFCK